MTNETLETIKRRRSVRKFLNKNVPAELLDAVLEAGLYAPNGRGGQSPILILVDSGEYRAKISHLNAQVMGKDIDPFYGAPHYILVLAEGNVSTFVEDGSCALENMMLAASSLGLGSVWINREREIFDSKEGKSLLQEWGLSTSLRGVGALAIGYPVSTPSEAAPRKEGRIVKI